MRITKVNHISRKGEIKRNMIITNDYFRLSRQTVTQKSMFSSALLLMMSNEMKIREFSVNSRQFN